jgi:hypothetical protein
MKTTREIISNLPDWCFGMLLTDNSVIKIKAGEAGFYKVSQPSLCLMSSELSANRISGEMVTRKQIIDTTNDFIDNQNKEMGITKAQRKAMEWGSQFGWDSKLSDPSVYDANGKPFSAKNPKLATT